MGKDEEIAVVCSVLDICFSFDVGRSMFDVGRSSFNLDVHLSMMVGLAGLDSAGPVDLLYQDESCHVVCKGHWGEG